MHENITITDTVPLSTKQSVEMMVRWLTTSSYRCLEHKHSCTQCGYYYQFTDYAILNINESYYFKVMCNNCNSHLVLKEDNQNFEAIIWETLHF